MCVCVYICVCVFGYIERLCKIQQVENHTHNKILQSNINTNIVKNRDKNTCGVMYGVDRDKG